jgi:hypothetical protein
MSNTDPKPRDLVAPVVVRMMDAEGLLALGRLPFEQGMFQADRESRATRADLADRLKVSLSAVNRAFAFDDENYFIAARRFPEMCAAMGTDTPIRWLLGRYLHLLAEGGLVRRHEVGVEQLFQRLAEIAAEYGDVARAATESASDGRLDKPEIKRLLREARDVMSRCSQLIGDLHCLLGEVEEQR